MKRKWIDARHVVKHQDKVVESEKGSVMEQIEVPKETKAHMIDDVN